MSAAPVRAAPTALAGAVGMLVLAQFFFNCVDAAGKLLVQGFPVLFVVWVRYVLQVVFMLVYVRVRTGGLPARPKRPGLQLVRGAVLIAFSAMFFAALKHLPQAESSAIVFTAPLAILVLAGPLLGERVTAARWLAALAGFAGMLLIVRPGNALAPIGVAFALAALAANVAFVLVTRKLATTEDPIVTIHWSAVVGIIGASLLLPLGGLPTRWPTPLETALFASIFITGSLPHFFLVGAYRRASASTLAPFSYGHIVQAALFGWAIFGDLPDRITLGGIALIIASGVAIALYERGAAADAASAAAAAAEAAPAIAPSA